MSDPQTESSLLRSEAIRKSSPPVKRWPPVSAVAGHFPDLPFRIPPKSVGLAPKALPKDRNVEPLVAPESIGRLVFDGEAESAHGNRRVRVRCAIELGGCGNVLTMLARYYQEGRCREHCGCLGRDVKPHPALDRKLTIDGRTLPLVAHVREAMQRGSRLDFGAVRRRIVDGWEPERAVTTPMRRWQA